jgi:hypothetical protein
MTVAPDLAQFVEDLARMMDELSAPELTLARAEVVRSRIARLLDSLGEPADSPRSPTFAERLEAGESEQVEQS